jgi:hypothetical protein
MGFVGVVSFEGGVAAKSLTSRRDCIAPGTRSKLRVGMSYRRESKVAAIELQLALNVLRIYFVE